MTTPSSDHPASAAPVSGTAPAASRRRLLYAGVAGAAALGGAGLAWWKFQPHAMEQGAEQALWTMEFEKPEGGSVALKSLAGKPLLLNFWATWCPPCVEELPMLNAFYREHGANGWQVLGLAIDQPSAVRKFLQRIPLEFPVGLAGLGGTDLGRSLGNLTGGLPFTVVLGGSGRVLHRKMGQITPQDLQRWAALR
ncbi:TlpA family protein disulfide reductase [Acidovorax sp. sif1233]|uniref:TlpA family protein disulfide reductase n=1 Tax=Acidovorax sp. sif1233 TaxID=2854792 RepID=UPI001C45B071|nr:TlpA disulfide reductase family protein [Acidovorax sp. sif1233]MBV7455906.1 TlpA family protein disulfide reductase [Acidovorax sp. sif1233]